MSVLHDGHSRVGGLHRRGPWIVLAAALVAGSLTGCSTRHDPNYDPYSTPGGGRPLLQEAEAGVDILGNAVDNFDRRMERTLY